MAALTILYIDDNPADRLLLVRALARFDSPHRVLPLDDPASGLEAARLYRPSVVLLDLNMPRLDGEDVLRALKADPVTRDIPVVVFSSEDNPRRAIELRSMGAAEYLVKPAGIQELVEVVVAAVERHAGP